MINRTKGSIKLVAILILLVIVFASSFIFAKSNMAQSSKSGLATVYGVYGGKVFPIRRSLNQNPRIEHTCTRVDWVESERIDKDKHPYIYDLVVTRGLGYCGIYSHLLSLYHTFGITKIKTPWYQRSIPIADEDKSLDTDGDGTRLNLDAVEWYLRNMPGTRHGVSSIDTEEMYDLYGKRCESVDFSDNPPKTKEACQALSKSKTDGADCTLSIRNSKENSGHLTGIESMYWDEQKRRCVIRTQNTFRQRDPLLNPYIYPAFVSNDANTLKVDYPLASQQNNYDTAIVYCCK